MRQSPACLTQGAEGIGALAGWQRDAPCLAGVSSACTSVLGPMWLKYICLHVLHTHMAIGKRKPCKSLHAHLHMLVAVCLELCVSESFLC